MKRLSKKGQVWVETVIYTLIGLAIMGLILTMAKPKIDQAKDEIVIEQAIEAMKTINAKIYEVQRAAGNKRAVDLTIGRGKLIVDTDEDKISWEMDASYAYTEEGLAVPLGGLNVTTVRGDPWKVTLVMDYNVDLQYDTQSTGERGISEAPTAYRLMIENKGKDPTSGDFIIDIREA